MGVHVGVFVGAAVGVGVWVGVFAGVGVWVGASGEDALSLSRAKMEPPLSS